MLKNLEKLCLINGTSGNENAVAQEIISQIQGFCDCKIDNLGNIIAFKKGNKTPKNKVMIAAHMDEVGLIVTDITDDGLLRFTTVGGIDSRVLIGRSVTIGEKNINGVIGTKAIHHQTEEERGTAVDTENLFIDIGALSKDDALNYINRGDFACFNSDFYEFGDGFIKSKAIDDRVGCTLMIELIKSRLEYDTWFLFSVQEEVGLRGAKAGSFTISPDIALVLEATTACDISGIQDNEKVCILGNGPVVSFMDRSTIYNKQLYNLAFETAKELNIPCQTKTMIAGGNDSGAIHTTKGGIKTLAISLPCRYIHSPSCVIKQSDLHHTKLLLDSFLPKLYNL